MGAHGRIRVQKFGFPLTGTYFRRTLGLPPQQRTVIARFDRECSDVVGNYPNPNGFLSTRFVNGPGIVNGSFYVKLGGVMVLDRQYVHCPASYILPSLSSNYSLPTSIEINDAVIKGMASTNPSAPVTSAPTFVGELKDIPGMVRDWGRRLLKWRSSRRMFRPPSSDPLLMADLAKHYSESHLTWKWVISPMVRDVTSILAFEEAANKRFNLLQDLRNEGLISGRAPSSAVSSVASASRAIESTLGDVIYAREDIYRSRRVWSSTQWSTTKGGSNASNLPTSDEDLRALSHRLVRGITSFETLSTAWELIPWSWLFDWFSNVGATVKAANNAVHAKPGNMCVMCERTARASYTVTTQSTWISVNTAGMTAESTIKWRHAAVTPIPFSLAPLPILDGSKWSILASLAVLRGR